MLSIILVTCSTVSFFVTLLRILLCLLTTSSTFNRPFTTLSKLGSKSSIEYSDSFKLSNSSFSSSDVLLSNLSLKEHPSPWKKILLVVIYIRASPTTF